MDILFLKVLHLAPSALVLYLTNGGEKLPSGSAPGWCLSLGLLPPLFLGMLCTTFKNMNWSGRVQVSAVCGHLVDHWDHGHRLLYGRLCVDNGDGSRKVENLHWHVYELFLADLSPDHSRFTFLGILILQSYFCQPWPGVSGIGIVIFRQSPPWWE